MVAGIHDVLLSQKDKDRTTCYTPKTEVMSTLKPLAINGCIITMSFAEKVDPAIGQSVAEMLIESYMRRCGA